MKANPLEAFYTKFAAISRAGGEGLPPNMQQEVGHFNVFNVTDLMLTYPNRPPMTFDRQPFYKISLIRGKSRVEIADRAIEVEGKALWFATSKVPYRWQPHDANQTGYFCIFTDEFLLPIRDGAGLEELPVFQLGACPVWELTDAEYQLLEGVFEKMAREMTSGYAYKYALLRAYLLELIHLGQKLQPTPLVAPAHNASARLTALFAELLERQFPLAIPRQQLHLRSAKDYADHLAVHVNHLNRILKETTGQTTTALIGNRVVQEAKILLKQTNWTVSEIADGLGFADVAHFCTFFKRQTGLVPSAFRD